VGKSAGDVYSSFRKLRGNFRWDRFGLFGCPFNLYPLAQRTILHSGPHALERVPHSFSIADTSS
jgi:hypothetical protein